MTPKGRIVGQPTAEANGTVWVKEKCVGSRDIYMLDDDNLRESIVIFSYLFLQDDDS